MKRLILADTGPLYAALDPDDQFHARAQRELTRLAREQRSIVLAYSTLLEAHTLVLYRLGKVAAAEWLEEITSGVTLVNPGAEDYREAQALAARFADQSITLFDATVAVITLRLGAEVWTYDHHFDLLRAAVWR